MTLLIMNNEITPDETKSTITSLKSGKVSLNEMIANEILKLLNKLTREIHRMSITQ